MDTLEIVLRFAVASFAVWRLSRLLFAKPGSGSGIAKIEPEQEDSTGTRISAGRALDLLCLAALWVSSRTAIWVAYGFAGVVLSWLAATGLSRLLAKTTAATGQTEELSCASCASGMQAHHG